MKICSIAYAKNGRLYEFTCFDCSLSTTIDKLKSEGSEIIKVTVHVKIKVPRKKVSTNEFEKRKYYNAKYMYYYRKYRKNLITKETFDNVNKCLKLHKKTCRTKAEFKIEFEKTIYSKK